MMLACNVYLGESELHGWNSCKRREAESAAVQIQWLHTEEKAAAQSGIITVTRACVCVCAHILQLPPSLSAWL